LKHLIITTIATVLLALATFVGPIREAAWDSDIAAVKQHSGAGTDVNSNGLNFSLSCPEKLTALLLTVLCFRGKL